MPDKQRSPLAEASLIAVCAIWGLTFVMVQDAVRLIPVTTFLAYRFIPAALLVAFIFRKQLAALGSAGVRAGAGMGLFLTAGYLFQTLGLERTTASNAGFITGLFVVLTPLFGALLLRQRITGLAWMAALVSTIGLFLLSGFGSGGTHLTGDALVFLCACSFSIHILVTDRAIETHHYGALLAVQLGVTGLVSLVLAIVGGDLVVPRSTTVWSALAVTSLLASALGFFVQTWAQRHAAPARIALILASEPVFAGFFAYALQGETLTALAWLGAGLIMVAILVVEMVPQLRLAKPLPER
ncbi:MAG TPA: DMT family transporter [Actinomycetota bacterium]|nr:DMT family transporter [Actinomycetota bacterium]